MSDAAGYAQLHAACFSHPRPWSQIEFQGFIEDKNCFFRFRDQGFCLGRVVADEAELLTLAVAPRSRRQGLGRWLLRAFEAEAKDRGARETFLEVAADNAAAQALYLGASYAQVGRRPAYYAGMDALILRKSL